MPLAPAISPHATTPMVPSRLGLALAIVSSIALCFPFVALGLVGPKYTEIFRDFGVQLTAYTRLLLDIGNALRTPIGIALASGILIVWFLAVCKAARTSRPLAVVMLLFSILQCLAMLTAFVAAFHLPLTEMIEQMQQQP